MKILRNEEGQVIPLAILGGAMFMGAVGLAIDVGLTFRAQRQAQVAADAGAIAGALELHYNGSTNASTNATNAAKANAIPSSSTVLVSMTGGGSHTGAGFVEVAVKAPTPTIFMAAMSGLLGGNSFKNGLVGARAVAGITPDLSCIYLLDPGAQGALSAKGAFTVNSPGCGVDINSNNDLAVCVTGNGNNGTFNAPYIKVRAPSLTTQGSCNGTLTSPTFTNVGKVTDPLGGITGPVSTTSPAWQGCTSTSSATTISANFSGSGTVCFSNFVQISGTVTLSGANAYVFENGVEIMTGAQVTSSGTFDIAGGTQKKNGGGSCLKSNQQTGLVQDSQSALNITAPAAGFSEGIALMEPSGGTEALEIQFGSNTSSSTGSGVITGIIYAPTAPVYLHDNGGTASATGLVSDTLYVCSSTLNITSYNNAPNNHSPLNSVQLVE
jgi:hypothetical protein